MAAVAAGQVTTSPLPSRCRVRAPDAASAPASNTAATDTCTAPGAGYANVLYGWLGGYDLDPTGGRVTIDWGAATNIIMPVTAKGALPWDFSVPIEFPENTAVVLTLAAGGSGVTGKIVGLFGKVQL